MGLFGKDTNINVNSDVVSNENQARTEVLVETRSTMRQQRKLAEENYDRDLDEQYRELAFAKYDASDPKQIVDTMNQLAAFIAATPTPGSKVHKLMVPYFQSAEANLKTGIALLKSIDPSNPMIAHFEEIVAKREKEVRKAQIAWSTFFVVLLAGMFGLLIFIITLE